MVESSQHASRCFKSHLSYLGFITIWKMLSSSSCPVECSQQLRWITLKGDHSFAEQFSYRLLLGEENEYEAWTLNGHASFHALLQPWRELHRLREVLLAWTSGQAKAPAGWLAGGPAIFWLTQPWDSLWISQAATSITQTVLWWAAINQIFICKGKVEGLGSARIPLVVPSHEVWVRYKSH